MNGVSSETLRLILDVQNRMGRELSGAHSNIKKVDRELTRVKESFKKTSEVGNKLGNTIKRIFTTAIIIMAIRKVIEFGREIISLGSRAEEIESKFRVVFKHLTKEANKWTKEFSKSVGRSANDIRKYMSTFQDTFVPLGFAREQAFGFSKVLTRLGVDLASFNNIAEVDVMRDLQSGIVGNTEVFRKYGVIINQITLNQELLNMGIEGGVRAATEAQKAQARLNLVIKGTADAQGDAIRTGGSFANIMRKIGATSERVLTGLGKAILPVASRIATMADQAMQPFADWIEEHQLQIANFFLNLPKIVKIVFESILPILDDLFTGANFLQIIHNMTQLLITGFKVAVSVFMIILGTAIASIPDLFAIAMMSFGAIVETITASPEMFESKMTRAEFAKTATDWKGRPITLSEKKLTREYEKYVKEWEKHNAFMRDVQTQQAKSMNNVMRNADIAIGDIGKVLDAAFVETGPLLQELKTNLAAGLSGPAVVKMVERIEALLGQEIITELKKTSENTEDMAKTAKAAAMARPTEASYPLSQGFGWDYIKKGYHDEEYYVGTQKKVEQNMQNMSGMFGIVTENMGEFGSSLVTSIATMGPVGIIFALLKPVLEGIFEILSPVIEEVLTPLFDVLRILGTVIGQLLLPQLQILGPFLEILSKALLFFINKAVIPVANLFIEVYKWIAKGVVYIWNAIATAINFLLGWMGVHLEMMEMPDIESIKPVSPEKGTKASKRSRAGGNVYNIIVRTEGIIDEESEYRVSARIKERIMNLQGDGR